MGHARSPSLVLVGLGDALFQPSSMPSTNSCQDPTKYPVLKPQPERLGAAQSAGSAATGACALPSGGHQPKILG